MDEAPDERPVLYLPDSPNVGAAAPVGTSGDQETLAADRVRANDLALKVAVADELSEYEKVAGRGVPEK